MYSELEPVGPTTVGDLGGEMQLTANAYERTFARCVPTAMGEVWFVVQSAFFVECRDVSAADSEEEVHEAFLVRFTQWFWCTDPHAPEATHFFAAAAFEDLAELSELSDDVDKARTDAFEALAKRACADLDPADIVWSGLPRDIHTTFGEPRPARRAPLDNGHSTS